MRSVSEKYANISNHYMANIDFSSPETITVPIIFRLFAIAQLSLSLTIGSIFGSVGRGLKAGLTLHDLRRPAIAPPLPQDANVVTTSCDSSVRPSTVIPSATILKIGGNRRPFEHVQKCLRDCVLS